MDWFIVISIISIIFSLIVFLELFRYIKLHYSNSEKYIEQYKNLDPASSKKKVIISLGGYTKDINKFKAMLNSILDQTVKVNNIYINLYNENENENFQIPEEFNNFANIFKCGNNYKNSCKFIPTALREDNNNTIIILLNNNIIYGKTFIEDLIKEYEKYNQSIISNHGILFTTDMLDYNKINDRNNKELDDYWIKECIKEDKKNMFFLKNYKSYL